MILHVGTIKKKSLIDELQQRIKLLYMFGKKIYYACMNMNEHVESLL